MEVLKYILAKLSGKKSALAALVGATIAYLAAKAVIGDAEVVYLSAINVVIFGGASYATGKLVYNK